MTRRIIYILALFCSACATVATTSIADWDSRDCLYTFEDEAAAAKVLYAVDATQTLIIDRATDLPFSGRVCTLDNGTFAKTDYRDGKLKEQWIYSHTGALSSIISTGEYGGLIHEVFTANSSVQGSVTLEGACASVVDSDSYNMGYSYGYSEGDGRELTDAEIFALLQSGKVDCGASAIIDTNMRRNAKACQYLESDIKLVDDELTIDIVTGKPINGIVCLSYEGNEHSYWGEDMSYHHVLFKDGIVHDSKKYDDADNVLYNDSEPLSANAANAKWDTSECMYMLDDNETFGTFDRFDSYESEGERYNKFGTMCKIEADRFTVHYGIRYKVYNEKGYLAYDVEPNDSGGLGSYTATAYANDGATPVKLHLEGECGNRWYGGRELELLEIIDWLTKGKAPACEIEPTTIYRSARKSACLNIDENELELIDGVLTNKSTNKPIDGLLCDLDVETPYKDGKEDGISKIYLGNRLYVETTYKNGEIIFETIYDSSVTKTPYQNGQRNGQMKQYDRYGSLEQEIFYKDGKKDGLETNYYDNGAIYSETNYKNDMLDGHIKYFYEDGSLERELMYKDGQKDGYDREFTEYGDLFQELLFEAGVALSGRCGNGEIFTEDELKDPYSKDCE
ncbi:MAG: toxin-antitoxin system YwqK family antitoxin [Deferribacteraceae bacterium]|jgi:antitoxin component YwqK of YwqJK toxin-antitoxin module|nr:toxin-antitoxin system YwqK family antitoxin [Deferribacteraceae bacterium]